MKYCQIASNSKKPVEKEWQNGKDWNELDETGSIGLVLGNGLIEIDCDHGVKLLETLCPDLFQYENHNIDGLHKRLNLNESLVIRSSCWSTESFGIIFRISDKTIEELSQRQKRISPKTNLYEDVDGNRANNAHNAALYTNWDNRQKERHIEFRYTGHQSIIQGEHPSGSEYTCDYRLLDSNNMGWVPELPKEFYPFICRTNETIEGTAYQADDFSAFLNSVQARELLPRISVQYADCYDDWVNIGMSVHWADPTDVGFDAWVEFSERSSNFHSVDQCKEKWESFSNSDTKDLVTLGTLYHYVNASTKTENFNPETGENDPGNWIFIVDQDKYFYLPNPDHNASRTAINTFMPKRTEEYFDHDTGRVKNRTLKGTQQISKKASSVTWHPGKNRLFYDVNSGITKLNTHNEYIAGEKGDVEIWHKLLRGLYPHEFKYIYQYLAYTLRFPDKAIGWAPYIVGPQGCGKDSIFKPMQYIMPGEFSKTEYDRLVNSNFDNAKFGQKLVIISEPNASMNRANWTRANSLKNLIGTTAGIEYEAINIKYMKGISQLKCQNYIIITNHINAIKVNNERRFCPCWTDKTPFAQNGFFNEYRKWLDRGGYKHLAWWLRHQAPLDGFDPAIAPITESARFVIEDSYSDFETLLLDIMDTHKAVVFKALQAPDSYFGNIPPRNAINAIIDQLGFMRTKERGHRAQIPVGDKRIPHHIVYRKGLNRKEATKYVVDWTRDNAGVMPGMEF